MLPIAPPATNGDETTTTCCDQHKHQALGHNFISPAFCLANHHCQDRFSPGQPGSNFAVQSPTYAGTTVLTPWPNAFTCMHQSSVMSEDAAGLATCVSSIEVSPDMKISAQSFSGQPATSCLPFEPGAPVEPVALPEPVLQPCKSNGSFAPHSSIPETPETPPKDKSRLLRRFSTRRSKRRRRQSTTTRVANDKVSGPFICRRRSDGSNHVPNGISGTVTSESEEDMDKVAPTTFQTPLSLERSRSLNESSPPLSKEHSPKLDFAVVVPVLLIHGTSLTKVKPKKRKRILLSLGPDNASLRWERKVVDVDCIREIRRGSDTSQARLDCGITELDKHKFFSILYDQSNTKGTRKMLHLLCDDVETLDTWTNTLEQIIKHRYGRIASLSAFHLDAVEEYWQQEMARRFDNEPHDPQHEEIDLAGVERLCRYLHNWSNTGQLAAKFGIADRRRVGRLNYPEFIMFLGMMKHRDDIGSIYRGLVKHHPRQVLTRDRFFEFLREVQLEDVDAHRHYWLKVFDNFTRKTTKDEANQANWEQDTPWMSEMQFVDYLSSSENLPLRPAPKEYTLDRPITEYFISSSHNTYLVGRQVASQSSVEGYIAALERGCRCVEIDCWDGPNGQPIVKHGYALTTSISFKEVINTVNKYAFVESPFPLWISLEVHCNPTQQEIMVAMMKSTFGSKLVTEPLDPSSDRLPSPSQLLGRILIKVKRPGELQSRSSVYISASPSVNGRRRGNSFTAPAMISPPRFTRPRQTAAASSPSSPVLASTMLNSTGQPAAANLQADVLNLPSSASESEEWADFKAASPRKQSTVKITQSLGELGVYNQGIKFNNTLDGPGSKLPNHIYSLMETTFTKFCDKNKDNKHAIFRHNMKYFMRVYPDQLRVKSDNFDPLIFWRRGVQMCALNWQTFDLPMQLNQAMFAGGTDRSGYVLKPPEMREIRRVDNLNDAQSLTVSRPRKQIRFRIEVISAQQLTSIAYPRSNRSLNPYVEVEIFHANDKRDKKENRSSVMAPFEKLRSCTDVVRGNGFNPGFQPSKRVFDFVVTTKFPELVFVRWSVRLSNDGETSSVRDHRSPTLGVYTAKLLSLNRGYRTLPLYNQNGDRYLRSTLFVRIHIDPDSISQVYLPCREESKLKSIGRSLFSRASASQLADR